MGYALLSNLPPIVGIYTAFFPVILYSIFGTSKHISMGTFAIVCIMVGKIVQKHSKDDNYQLTNENSTIENEHFASPVEIASAVCLVVGVIQVRQVL